MHEFSEKGGKGVVASRVVNRKELQMLCERLYALGSGKWVEEWRDEMLDDDESEEENPREHLSVRLMHVEKEGDREARSFVKEVLHEAED